MVEHCGHPLLAQSAPNVQVVLALVELGRCHPMLLKALPQGHGLDLCPWCERQKRCDEAAQMEQTLARWLAFSFDGLISPQVTQLWQVQAESSEQGILT